MPKNIRSPKQSEVDYENIMYGISISKYPCVRFTIGTQYVYVLEFPKDDLPLAIVESKYSAIVNGVSDKDDFFIHTPRKTIAEILETKHICYLSTWLQTISIFYGGKIHASVKKELVAQFNHFLRQGYSLLINFSVTHSCGSYKTTTHAYRISFLSTTRVRSCEQLPEDLSGFEPVKYKDVLDGTLNPDYLVGKYCLPRDELPLAIVESKNSAIVNGVSAKDDFFILTPRKTIAQILETKQESEDGQFHDMETQSDAPEVSLAIQGLVSKQSESFDLTPAKRIRAVNIDTKEILDDNSVTRSVSSVKIKKEKFAKSD
ncbi:unnamed protein product [Brassica oleracea var. botrytis]